MSTPTLAPAGTPTVNSKWRVDVDLNYGGTDEPDWKQVRGCNSVTPTVANTTQDATDYDAEGWGADAVTLRKWSLPLVLLRKQYAAEATATYDEGQEELRAAADALDLVHVRWYERGVADGEAYEGYALVQWEPQGGTADGLSTVNATLLGQGARRGITSPSAGAGAGVATTEG